MDYYGADRKLSELGEQDLEDFLDQDMFTPPTNDSAAMETFGLVDNCDDTPMDSQWLDNFFDDPVLNDRMMTDALQPRRVQSEHSYSLTNGERICVDGQIKEETPEKDLDVDLLGSAINPNMTMTSGSVTTLNTTYVDTTPTQICIKQEPQFSQNEIAMATNSIATTPAPVTMTTRTSTQQPHPHTLLKQPTIILATQHSPLGGETSMLQSAMASCGQKERLVLPKVNIKVEAFDTASNMSSSPEHSTMYDSIGLPPTPPSSNNSDSEGCQSPQRSAPPSPIRHSQLLRQHAQTQHTLGGASAALSQPLFTSPIPTSGILMLSDEEKRTLVAEGYPIPNKLPLTKQEEKNLKKIRRKIKNKISAQESRRKKKEYLETLEKKVEAYNSENCDLKKKVELLENNNRSLLGQLQKLQSLVSKVPRPPTPSTQTGTCLMVLVLFFAVFVGTWSPLTWSIGYSMHASSPVSAPETLGAIHIHGPSGQPIGPEVEEPMTDAYATPNMRSRVLLSIREDSDEAFGPNMPFSYQNFFMKWFSGDKASCSGDGVGMPEAEADFTMNPPQVQTVPEDADQEVDQGEVTSVNHMSLNYTAKVMTSHHHVNTTA